MTIHRHLADLIYGAERSWQYSKEQSALYGSLSVALIPTAFLIERSLTSPSFDTALFRLFPTIVCIPFLFFEKLPQWIRVWFPFYWIIGLTTVFPFTYSVVLLQNAARATGPLHPIWQWEFLFSMFVLVQFTSHTKLCIALFGIGVLGGVLSLLFVPEPNWQSVLDNVVLVAPVFLITLIVLLVSNRHVFKAQEEKLLALRYLGSNLAHELRTPLATIRNISNGSKNLLPILVSSYEKLLWTQDGVPAIRRSQLRSLESALVDIGSEVDHSNAIIDLLLLNTLERPVTSLEIENVPAEELVQECIEEFPFNNQMERSLVSIVVKEDFVAFGPRILLKHILFNLLKNAVRHVQKVRNPCIRVTVDASDYSISVLNNGPEIPKANLRKIFQRFFTTVSIGEGNGIGLSFCKIAMETIGGSISADSSKRNGTTFKLRFAKSRPKLLPRIAQTPDIVW